MSDDNLAIKYDEIFEDDKLGIKSSVIDFALLIEQNTYIEGAFLRFIQFQRILELEKPFFVKN